MPLSGSLRSIVAMVAACAAFACMDALLKVLAGIYPPLQVTALRGLTALPLVCLYLVWRREVGVVFGRRLRWGLPGLAVSGFLGQLAISEAFRHGQAAVVARFEYTALAWAIGLDWVFWHTVPDAWTLAGGAIIIASGISLVRREAPRAVPVVAAS